MSGASWTSAWLRDSDEWTGTHRLDALRVNLALFAYWWGLDSICLALSVLLINTNCITSGVEPNQCALSALAHGWIGLRILALLLFIHIREKRIDSNWIHHRAILLIMYINSKLRITVLSFDRKVELRITGMFLYHDSCTGGNKKSREVARKNIWNKALKLKTYSLKE